MFTLCIRYTINPDRLDAFAAYARALAAPIARCGGTLRGYFLPTRLAGPTNAALALIDFADLAAYERYRARMAGDAENVALLGQVAAAGAILVEDRSFMVPAA